MPLGCFHHADEEAHCVNRYSDEVSPMINFVCKGVEGWMYLENEGKRRRCLFVWCAGAGGDAKAGSVSVTYKGVPPLPNSTMVCHGVP